MAQTLSQRRELSDASRRFLPAQDTRSESRDPTIGKALDIASENSHDERSMEGRHRAIHGIANAVGYALVLWMVVWTIGYLVRAWVTR